LNIDIGENFKWEYEKEIYKNAFTFKVIEKEQDTSFNYINYFLDILD
jgi:hypothetical protein